MNNYKLIKLKEGYLIVSDEMIKENEYVYHSEVSQEFTIVNLLKEGDERYSKGQHIAEGVYKHKPTTNTWYKKERKIIASTFIPELPNIDFNNLEEEFGIVDVEKLALEERPNINIKDISFELDNLRKVYAEGFNKCLELNKDKLYTEEQLLKAIEMARDITDGEYTFSGEDISGCAEISTYGWENKYNDNDIVRSLQSKIEWNIEIEMETKCYCGHTSHCECEEIEGKPFIQRPRLNNNQIKILKIK
jgi:hypothetical protein